MNIEVKKSIEIDVVLDMLEDFKLEAENKEGSVITTERKEMIELLEDTIQIIKVLVKKNKQLRDINKNLSDKVVKKNESIEGLAKMCKELNDKVFELESKVEENKCCCKGESEKQKPEEYDLQDVLINLRKLSKEQTGTEFVAVEKETLQDSIHFIEVLIKKNKQLRDTNKFLTDKITRKNNTISELSKQAKELNDKLFEIQKEFYSCKNDTCNNCCKKKESEEYQNYDGKPKKCKEQHEKEYDL